MLLFPLFCSRPVHARLLLETAIIVHVVVIDVGTCPQASLYVHAPRVQSVSCFPAPSHDAQAFNCISGTNPNHKGYSHDPCIFRSLQHDNVNCIKGELLALLIHKCISSTHTTQSFWNTNIILFLQMTCLKTLLKYLINKLITLNRVYASQQ